MTLQPHSKSEWLRECCVCYVRGAEKDFILCNYCRAMVYCSEDCQLHDLASSSTDNTGYEINHQTWCTIYKSFMDREKELCNFPFTYISETADRTFHEHHLVQFLQRCRVYGKGMWRWECPALPRSQAVKKCGYFTRKEEDKWILKEEALVLQSTLKFSLPSAPLTTWQEYYSLRGLPLHSPIAAILSYPMTLYYILTTCLKNDEPELFENVTNGGPLEVHLLGVEKEVEFKEAFLECARLLPHCQLNITMVGLHISKSVHKYHWEKDNFSMSVHHGLYHETDIPSPHIAIGFNAGLPAYPTWPSTLTKLKAQKTPAYFSDQSEYSCHCVSSALPSLGILGISPLLVNPFRSPLRIVTREQNMPWFPNAFLFRLLYDQG